MTVHGAKGLEAPVVILADTTSPPDGPPIRRVCSACGRERGAPTPARSTGPGKGDDVAPVAAARARAQSRAAERIPAPAVRGDDARRRPADRVRRRGRAQDGRRAAGTISCAMRSSRTPTKIPPRTATPGLRWRSGVGRDEPSKPRWRLRPRTRPEWLGRNVAARRAACAPSAARRSWTHRLPCGGGERRARCARHAGASADAVAARRSGRAPRRAARQLSRTCGCDFTEAERDHLVAPGAGRARRSALAPLIGAGSRAEVPIVGIVGAGRPHVVSGQVDRLAVTAGPYSSPTTRPTGRRRGASRTCRKRTWRSLRSIAQCSARSTRARRPGRPDLDRCT